MKTLDNILRVLAVLLIISILLSLFTLVRDIYVFLQFISLWGILQARKYLPYWFVKKPVLKTPRDKCGNPKCKNPHCTKDVYHSLRDEYETNELIYGYKPIEVYPAEKQ